MKIKVWDKNKFKVKEEREIESRDIFAIDRFTLHDSAGKPLDGVSITMKNEQGGSGERFLSNENYHEVCRRFGFEAKGASGLPDSPSNFRNGAPETDSD